MPKPTVKPLPPAADAVEDEDTEALLEAALIAEAELAEVVLAEAVPMVPGWRRAGGSNSCASRRRRGIMQIRRRMAFSRSMAA
jgi:hypothetical protein